jgi:DNA-binding LacI/PurR family transcriptional regulator
MVRHGVKSIAKIAGVSPATVSLALNKDPRVAEKTRKKIKALADELNYIPNNFGRALQSSKSGLIGFLLPEINRSYFSEIFQGAGEVATEHNYAILATITHYRRMYETTQLNVYLEKQVDGIIIEKYHPDSMDKFFASKRYNIPVVVLSSEFNTHSFTVVQNDDRETGIIAAKYLLALGHRRLAFCFGKELGHIRYQSSREECMKHDIADYQMIMTADDLRRILSSPERPTVIIAYSDDNAIEVIHIAEELGLRIPQDLSVIGVDDSDAAKLPAYKLTTIAPQKKNIGRTAMSTIFDLIAGKSVKSTYLKPELIIRNTTAPPIK